MTRPPEIRWCEFFSSWRSFEWFTTKISSWKSSKLAYLRLFDKKNEEGRKKPIGGRLKFSLRMFLRILLKYSLFISFYFIFDTIY